MAAVLHTFEATSHSAISVVNAIPAMKGVTIAIDIPCSARVSLVSGDGFGVIISSRVPDPHGLVKKSALYALGTLRKSLPQNNHLKIQIDSRIPVAVGLKSSSAVSVATTKAVFGLFARADDSRNILRSSCRASIDSGASLTGAYDDASASLLGGVAFTDNSKFKLIKHCRVPKKLGSAVLVLVPKKKVLTSSLEASRFNRYRKESVHAFQSAMRGELASSMLLNSIIISSALGYSLETVTSALNEGATAAGITGKGPAVAAICSDDNTLKRIRKKWRENKENTILTCSVSQPKKIVAI